MFHSDHATSIPFPSHLSRTLRKNSGRSAKEDIQADENRVADTWSSETFTKFGIASVFFLLFVFVFVIGPPPDDGRCSLPWC